MLKLSIDTVAKRQIVDITDQVNGHVPKGQGSINIFAMHTTTAITTADLDPGTDLDFLDALDELLPDLPWRHPHDPSHTPDHLLASIIGPGVSIPFADGELQLGAWQRVILVELDGPRTRHVALQF